MDKIQQCIALLVFDGYELKDIAVNVNYSERHVERICQRVFGCTYTDMHKAWLFIRLRQYFDTLAGNTVSVTKLSEYLGYDTCSTRFYDAIKKLIFPKSNEKICTCLNRKAKQMMTKYKRIPSDERCLLQQVILLTLSTASNAITLKDLVDKTGYSKAYVSAALKSLATPDRHVIGMHGLSGSPRGYFIAENLPDNNSATGILAAHDSWIANWKASMGIINKVIE